MITKHSILDAPMQSRYAWHAASALLTRDTPATTPSSPTLIQQQQSHEPTDIPVSTFKDQGMYIVNTFCQFHQGDHSPETEYITISNCTRMVACTLYTKHIVCVPVEHLVALKEGRQSAHAASPHSSQ